MTEENKKLNIAEELDRSTEALKALLLMKGLEPKSHEGALSLFGMHFVKSGMFKTDDAHVLARLMKYREEADYSLSYKFTERDYTQFKIDAQNLIGGITTYLRAQGYL